MPSPNSCIRCGGTMEAGFVIDRGHHSNPEVQTWIEGAPAKSFWSGIKTKGLEQHPVSTFRCMRCGYLESYAVSS